jgi:hypothetical protein
MVILSGRSIPDFIGEREAARAKKVMKAPVDQNSHGIDIAQGEPGSMGRGRTTLAGFPATSTPAGTSRITTAHAPTTVLSPTVTPGPMKACVQTHTPSPMWIFGRSRGRFGLV